MIDLEAVAAHVLMAVIVVSVVVLMMLTESRVKIMIGMATTQIDEYFTKSSLQ